MAWNKLEKTEKTGDGDGGIRDLFPLLGAEPPTRISFGKKNIIFGEYLSLRQDNERQAQSFHQ